MSKVDSTVNMYRKASFTTARLLYLTFSVAAAQSHRRAFWPLLDESRYESLSVLLTETRPDRDCLPTFSRLLHIS